MIHHHNQLSYRILFRRAKLSVAGDTAKHSLRSMAGIVDASSASPARMEFLQGVQFFLYDEVASTMDVARDILKGRSGVTGVDSGELPLADVFVVLAKQQVAGRGSRGRGWVGGENNLFMTTVLKQAALPCPLMHFPLRVGTLISPHIRSRIQTPNTQTYLKWPNDLLIGKEKVCGALVEVEDGHMLVGIGCNIASAPSVPTSGPDRGRAATCLHAHNKQLSHDKEAYKTLATEIAVGFSEWVSCGLGSDSALQCTRDFSQQMDKESTQRIRSGADADREVLPVRINPDGSLRVRMLDTGEEKSLLSDYLF